MAANHWVIIYRFACAVLAVLFAIGLIFIFVPKYSDLRKLQQKKRRFQVQNQELEDRAAELRAKQEKFLTDPAFVERTARDIGMIKPNEVVFKFTNESSRTEPAPSY